MKPRVKSRRSLKSKNKSCISLKSKIRSNFISYENKYTTTRQYIYFHKI